MENQTITTGATPAPVNNQPTDGAPNPFKKVILALTALLVVGGVGAGVYLNMGTPAQGDPNEPPPSLSAAGGLKGSFVESLQGFLQYEAKDVVAFDAGKAALATKFGAPGVVKGNAAVNYMTVNADGMTMADFVNNNSPVADKNLSLFLIYSAGQGGLSKGFHSYPVGPFGAATKEIKKDDLSKITLARNSGVVMISKSNGENYGVLDPSVAPTSSVFPTPLLPDDKSGWVLVSGNGKLLDLLGTNKDRVISAWGLKDPTTFEKVDLNTYAFSTYHVAWVNLLPKSAVTDPTPTAVAPKITSVTPKTAEQGQKAVAFIVTGTDLGGAKVEFSPAADFQNITGLTVDTTSTSVKFIADIADAATPGLKEIKVTTAKGSVVDKSFEVKAKSDLPLISSITPVVAYPEDKFTLQIVGTNFKDATVLSLSTDLVLEPLNTLKISDDFRTITLDARVTKQATPGLKEIKVTTAKGSVTTNTFEVKAKALKPVITSLSATEGTIGTLVSITVTGENIADINDLRIGNVSVQTAFDDVGGKKLATFTLLDNVPVGSQDLVVVSPTGGTSEAKKFTIKAAAADPLVGKTVLVHYSADAGKTYTSQWFEAKVTKSTSSSFLGMKFTQYDIAYSNKIVKSADGKAYDIGAVGGDVVTNVSEANIAVPGDARYFDAEKDLLAVARYGAESGWSVKYNKKNADGSYAFTYLDDNTSKTTFNINNLYKILGAKTHLTAGETIKAVPTITSISVKEGVKNELIKLDMVGANLDTVSSLKLGGVVAGLPASQTATTAHFEFFVNSTLTAGSQKLEVVNPSGSASVDFMVKEKADAVATGDFKVGSSVLALWNNHGTIASPNRWYDGKIAKINTTAVFGIPVTTYDVNYSDGDKDTFLTPEKIVDLSKPIGSISKVKAGQIVIAKTPAKNEWYNALVIGDGSADSPLQLILVHNSEIINIDVNNTYVSLAGYKEVGNFLGDMGLSSSVSLKTTTDAPSAITFTSPTASQSFTAETLKASGLSFEASDTNTKSYNVAAGKYYMNYKWTLKNGDTTVWGSGWTGDFPTSTKTCDITRDDGVHIWTCPSGTIPASAFANVASGTYTLVGDVGDGKNGASSSVIFTVTGGAAANVDDAIMADLKNIEIKFKGPEVDPKTGDTKFPFSFSQNKLNGALYDANGGKPSYVTIETFFDDTFVNPMVNGSSLMGMPTQAQNTLFIRRAGSNLGGNVPCMSWEDDNTCSAGDRYLPTKALGEIDNSGYLKTPRVITLPASDKASHKMKISLFLGTDSTKKWLKDYTFDYQQGVAKLEIQSLSTTYISGPCPYSTSNCDVYYPRSVDVIIKNTGTYIIPESEKIDYNLKAYNKTNEEIVSYKVNGVNIAFPLPGKSVTVRVNSADDNTYINGQFGGQVAKFGVTKVALFKGISLIPLSESPATLVAPVK